MICTVKPLEVKCTDVCNWLWNVPERKGGSPGDSLVKNSPANAEDTGLLPGLDDPTCRGTAKLVRHDYWACALEPVSHNYWSLHALEPMLCIERSHRRDKPTLHNSQQLEKNPQSRRDPAQPKLNKCIKKERRRKWIHRRTEGWIDGKTSDQASKTLRWNLGIGRSPCFFRTSLCCWKFS